MKRIIQITLFCVLSIAMGTEASNIIMGSFAKKRSLVDIVVKRISVVNDDYEVDRKIKGKGLIFTPPLVGLEDNAVVLINWR